MYWFCYVLQIITDLGLEAIKSHLIVSVDGKPVHSLAGLSAQRFTSL